MPPRVSVVMTLCNGKDFLPEAIESVLNQTYRDFEFIIIDDGSTDSTPAIVERYRRVDSRIHSFRNQHRGLLTSLNDGCRLASGEYIARMDADDVAFTDRFEKQVNFLDQHSDVAVLGAAMKAIDENSTPILGLSFNVPTNAIKDFLKTSNCIMHPTVMMRTDVFDGVGGYRKAFQYAEDYDLWLRVAERYELANLADPVLYYRLHPYQTSIQHIEQQTLSTIAALLSARGRQETGVDPLAGVEQVTRELLTRLGVSDETVRTALADNCFYLARYMLHSNNYGTAQLILGEACKVDSNCYEHFAAYFGYESASSADLQILLRFASSQPKHVQDLMIGNFHLGRSRHDSRVT